MNIDKHIIKAKDLTIDKAADGCFVSGLPNQSYHAFNGISKSGLDCIVKSPAHLNVRKVQTSSMRLGSAIHSAVLEPEAFSNEYVLMDGVTRASKAYKEMTERVDPGVIMVGSEVGIINNVKKAINDDDNASTLLNKKGYIELSAFATCPDTGALIRCRFDKLAQDGEAIDLKTTQSIEYREIQKTIWKYRYHVQHAFYNYVFKLITGHDLDAFTFLFVEKQAPYGVKQYRLDDLSILRGEKDYIHDLNIYQQCNENNNWPKVDSSLEYVSIPEFVLEDDCYE